LINYVLLQNQYTFHHAKWIEVDKIEGNITGCCLPVL